MNTKRIKFKRIGSHLMWILGFILGLVVSSPFKVNMKTKKHLYNPTSIKHLALDISKTSKNAKHN